jgi:Nuclease-related domain
MHAKTEVETPADNAPEATRATPFKPHSLLIDRALPLCALLAVLWVVVAVEWLWTLRIAVPNPLYATAIAALMTLYVAGRIHADWSGLQRQQVRAETGRELGEFLDRLRGLGYRVFHELPADGGNIDHVIVSTHGLFCIDQQARRKPADGDARIRFDGAAVSLNGGPFDSSVINVARTRARQLQRLVKEHSGLDLPVQAVLIFPGWSVDSIEAQNHADVWVITSKALPMWIRNVPERVAMQDVRRAASQLAAYLLQYD